MVQWIARMDQTSLDAVSIHKKYFIIRIFHLQLKADTLVQPDFEIS